jgi:hypothetical protein
VLKLSAATDRDDALEEVENLLGDAFGELAGTMLALGIVFLLVQAAISFVPRPVRPLAQLAGLGGDGTGHARGRDLVPPDSDGLDVESSGAIRGVIARPGIREADHGSGAGVNRWEGRRELEGLQ